MKYMLDTNMCVFAIKKNAHVLAAIKAHKDSGLFISAITLSELEHGICNSHYHEKNRLALTNFLLIITPLAYDDKAAQEYGKIRADLQKQGLLIGNMDMLIAAHAKSIAMTLVTNNTREFTRVRGLTIEDWSVCVTG
jgi:tRNA(fMet)-specific endonuclease VapC